MRTETYCCNYFTCTLAVFRIRAYVRGMYERAFCVRALNVCFFFFCVYISVYVQNVQSVRMYTYDVNVAYAMVFAFYRRV